MIDVIPFTYLKRHFLGFIRLERVSVANEPINNQCYLSSRNQSVDFQCKLIDWFLYDGEHCSLMD